MGAFVQSPSPSWSSSSPACYGDLVSPQPHPLPDLGLVGSWVLLPDLSFLVWEGLAHRQAGKLGPREHRKVTWLAAAAPGALQARWTLSSGRRELAQPPSSLSTLTDLTCLHLGLFSPFDPYLIFPLHKLGPGVQAFDGVHGILSGHLPPVSALWHAIPLLPSPTAVDQEGQGQIRAKDREDLSWGFRWATFVILRHWLAAQWVRDSPKAGNKGNEGLEHGCPPAILSPHGHGSALLLLCAVLQSPACMCSPGFQKEHKSPLSLPNSTPADSPSLSP